MISIVKSEIQSHKWEKTLNPQLPAQKEGGGRGRGAGAALQPTLPPEHRPRVVSGASSLLPSTLPVDRHSASATAAAAPALGGLGRNTTLQHNQCL